MPKIRLDALVAEKYSIPVSEAAALIMERRVLVEDQPIIQPGTQVKEDVTVRIREKKRKFASRSGYKLEGALQNFQIDPKDKIVCDIGASNGGFTDCLLRYGAKRVFAVDVAYGILEYRLRQDKRVTVFDKTNARELTEEMLGTLCDMVSIDVSFISLNLIFPAVNRILEKNGICISLIKPQFEAPKEAVGKNGIIKDSAILPELFQSIIRVANENQLYLHNLMVSPIHGQNGNVEYLAYWKREPGLNTKEIEELLQDSLSWKPMDSII